MTKQQFDKSGAHRVRLFPSLRIKSEKEAEQRATAALLAMIHAVPEFRKAILRRAGAPAGHVACFTEVPFLLQMGEGVKPEEVRPDGLIEASRAKKQWIALVEVKVGRNSLEEEQVDQYHRLAKQEGMNAVITVSNQASRADRTPPVKLKGHLLKSVPVVHFSWHRLLSEAQVLSRKKAVSDPDQKWMLDEWIRYVDDEKSLIVVPPHMGRHWGDVLKAFQTGSPAANSPELQDVVGHWLGYLRNAALRLRAKLGVEVKVQAAKEEKKHEQQYVQRLSNETCASGALRGTFKVPDAAGPISLDVFLPSKRVRYGLTVGAPTSGFQATRVKWIARQLRDLPEIPIALKVTAEWSEKGVVTEGLARDIAEDAARLSEDKQKAPISKQLMPVRFFLHLTAPLPPCRGKSVLEGLTAGLEDFYRDVVERIVPHVRQAPRLPEEETHAEPKSQEAATSEEETTPGDNLPETTDDTPSPPEPPSAAD